MNRDVKDLLDQADQHGWSIRKTARNHWRLQHRCGAIVIVANSPSDWRAMKNAQARIQRIERDSK